MSQRIERTTCEAIDEATHGAAWFATHKAVDAENYLEFKMTSDATYAATRDATLAINNVTYRVVNDMRYSISVSRLSRGEHNEN